MKRCPKCNRTFTTNTQKFCTHDGGILEGVDMGPETVRMETAEFNDDAPTKVISREPAPEAKPDFDPFKTVISRSDGTVTQAPRDTSDITAQSPAATMAPRPIPPAPPTTPPPDPPVAPQSSVPLPPPQSSPSAPTIALTGPIPMAAAAQTAPPPPVSQPSAPATPAPAPPVAPPAKKKSRLPLVLGILVVLLFLGGGVLGAVYWFVARPMLAARKVVEVDNPPHPPTKAPTPNIVETPRVPETRAPEPPVYSPPADAVEFVNSKEHLSGALADHYVDFSFYYPERWQKDPTAGVPGARNFAQVERRLPPDFTQENFAVAWNSSAGPVSENRALFHTLAENLGAQFEKKFPGYKKISEGETKVGVYDAYEFRFEGVSKDTAKGDLKLWGRVVFLPPQDGGKDGVTLLMLATSLAPELKSVNDVGVKGDLPMMLESFRFGKN